MTLIKSGSRTFILAVAVVAVMSLAPAFTSAAHAAASDGARCWVGRVWKVQDVAKRPYLEGWYAAFHIEYIGPASREVTGVWRIRTASGFSRFSFSEDLRRMASAREVAKLSSNPRADRPRIALLSCG
jgi:hypothetical protein